MTAVYNVIQSNAIINSDKVKLSPNQDYISNNVEARNQGIS